MTQWKEQRTEVHSQTHRSESRLCPDPLDKGRPPAPDARPAHLLPFLPGWHWELQMVPVVVVPMSCQGWRTSLRPQQPWV